MIWKKETACAGHSSPTSVWVLLCEKKWISAPGLRRPLRFTKPLHRCLCLQRVKWLPGHDWLARFALGPAGSACGGPVALLFPHMHSRFRKTRGLPLRGVPSRHSARLALKNRAKNGPFRRPLQGEAPTMRRNVPGLPPGAFQCRHRGLSNAASYCRSEPSCFPWSGGWETAAGSRFHAPWPAGRGGPRPWAYRTPVTPP